MMENDEDVYKRQNKDKTKSLPRFLLPLQSYLNRNEKKYDSLYCRKTFRSQ